MPNDAFRKPSQVNRFIQCPRGPKLIMAVRKVIRRLRERRVLSLKKTTARNMP